MAGTDPLRETALNPRRLTPKESAEFVPVPQVFEYRLPHLDSRQAYWRSHRSLESSAKVSPIPPARKNSPACCRQHCPRTWRRGKLNSLANANPPQSPRPTDQQHKIPARVTGSRFILEQVADTSIFSRFIRRPRNEGPLTCCWTTSLAFGAATRHSRRCDRGRSHGPRWRKRWLSSTRTWKTQLGGAHPTKAVLREVFVAALFTFNKHGYWHKNIPTLDVPSPRFGWLTERVHLFCCGNR